MIYAEEARQVIRVLACAHECARNLNSTEKAMKSVKSKISKV